jgi:hypothetical protein
MKIKILLTGKYPQLHAVCIRNINGFVFFHIRGLNIFASTLPDFGQSIRAA